MPALTVRNVADDLHVSRGTVYRMIRDGEIGCLRIRGTSIRITPEQLADYRERAQCPARDCQSLDTPLSSDLAGESGTSAGPTPRADGRDIAARDAKIVSLKMAMNGRGR